jgi:hypothetical protein
LPPHTVGVSFDYFSGLRLNRVLCSIANWHPETLPFLFAHVVYGVDLQSKLERKLQSRVLNLLDFLHVHATFDEVVNWQVCGLTRTWRNSGVMSCVSI